MEISEENRNFRLMIPAFFRQEFSWIPVNGISTFGQKDIFYYQFEDLNTVVEFPCLLERNIFIMWYEFIVFLAENWFSGPFPGEKNKQFPEFRGKLYIRLCIKETCNDHKSKFFNPYISVTFSTYEVCKAKYLKF